MEAAASGQQTLGASGRQAGVGGELKIKDHHAGAQPLQIPRHHNQGGVGGRGGRWGGGSGEAWGSPGHAGSGEVPGLPEAGRQASGGGGAAAEERGAAAKLTRGCALPSPQI